MSKRVLFACLIGLVMVGTYAGLIRPWHHRWGATDAEIGRSLPGDELTPNLKMSFTRAITILATPAEVWPWLVQLGQGRGGFYSHHWFENILWADMYNADHIVPELQTLELGDRLSLQRNGPAIDVIQVESQQTLVLGTGWSMYLEPEGTGSTRLIVRSRHAWEPNLLNWFYFQVIFDPIHYVMEMGMMLGIKERTEAAARS